MSVKRRSTRRRRWIPRGIAGRRWRRCAKPLQRGVGGPPDTTAAAREVGRVSKHCASREGPDGGQTSGSAQVHPFDSHVSLRIGTPKSAVPPKSGPPRGASSVRATGARMRSWHHRPPMDLRKWRARPSVAGACDMGELLPKFSTSCASSGRCICVRTHSRRSDLTMAGGPPRVAGPVRGQGRDSRATGSHKRRHPFCEGARRALPRVRPWRRSQ
jgi:hypothetical protein